MVNMFTLPEERMNTKEQPTLKTFLAQIAQLFDKDRVETTARHTKFVQRQSKLTGHIFLVTFTFAMSLYENPTLEQLTALLDQVLSEFDEEIQRVSLHQRINTYAVEFFQAMLAQAISLNLPSAQTLNFLKQFKEVILLDSTSFQVPANLAHLFRGSGGSASQAAIKIRFGYDLKSGRLFYRIQAGNTPDNRDGNGAVEEITARSLRISDLGFFNIQAFAELDEKGAFYLSRMKSGVNVYQRTEDGQFILLDMVSYVKHMKENKQDLEVYLRQKQRFLKTRLIVEKVPEQVIRQRIRGMKRQCQKKGRSFSPDYKILASVNRYITNVPPQQLPSRCCRLLYRIRWQIELMFKLWKSNFALARVAGIRKERVLCTLYAKLLCIVVTSKLVFWVRNDVWNTRKQELSEFRASKILKTFLPQLPSLLLFAPSQVPVLLQKAIQAMTKQMHQTQTTHEALSSGDGRGGVFVIAQGGKKIASLFWELMKRCDEFLRLLYGSHPCFMYGG